MDAAILDRHPLVVHATPDNWRTIGQGPVDDDAGVDPRDEGAIQGLISQASVGAGDLSFGLGRFQPGEYHLRHQHPHGSEWYYFVGGTCIVYLDDDAIRVGPGSAVYIPPGTIHAVKNDSDGVVEMLWGVSAGDYGALALVYDE
ncbi:cupin domain-containing protein [Microbacterium sp. NPDC096154]|uniref:cupin domain-containing protein n=1 Tax=Microbacterium sp. NPDC096154 TaxID=3155549 RepID=UPI003328ECC5